MMSFDGEAIIHKLENECRRRGNRYLLHVNYNNDKNIMISCPFHSNGQERRPSCGIRKDMNVGHCFACGWSGNISDVVSKVLGMSTFEADDWVRSNFGVTDLWERKNKPERENLLPVSRRQTAEKVEYPGFTTNDLIRLNKVHPYMYERGLDDKTIKKFKIGYDEKIQAITFPVYTLDGDPAFIAYRSVNTKFFHYPKGVLKPLYMGERVIKNSDCLWVCESCLDALIVAKNGFQAVAMMGLGSRNQIDDLKKLHCKTYILALDNDRAGQEAEDSLYEELKYCGIIEKAIIPPGMKDINDCMNCFSKIRQSFY